MADEQKLDLDTLKHDLESQLRFNRYLTVICTAAMLAVMATLLHQVIYALPATICATQVSKLEPMVFRWKEIERQMAAQDTAAPTKEASTSEEPAPAAE